jgi:hypothetical protein
MLGIHNDLVHHDHIDLYTGTIDLPEGATAGYSVRRISSTYFGPGVRVINSSNVELDIKFLPNGNLDTVTMEAHCGGGDGHVTQWYDQTGLQNHLVQSTAGLRPKIVSSGTTITNPDNGKVALEFAGDTMKKESISLYPTSISGLAQCVVVAKADSGISSVNNLFTIGDTLGGVLMSSRIDPTGSVGDAAWKIFSNQDRDYISSDFFDSYVHIVELFVSILRAGSNGDTTNLSAAAVGSLDTADDIYMGGDQAGSNLFNGFVQEFIMYNVGDTLSESVIEGVSDDVNSYYGVY